MTLEYWIPEYSKYSGSQLQELLSVTFLLGFVYENNLFSSPSCGLPIPHTQMQQMWGI